MSEKVSGKPRSQPWVPFVVNVSHMIPMELVECYCMFKITCGKKLFCFGKVVEAIRPSLEIPLGFRRWNLTLIIMV